MPVWSGMLGKHPAETGARRISPVTSGRAAGERRDAAAGHTAVCAELILLGAGLLFCIGMALGTTWTIQTMRWKLERLADERREVNDEWLTLHTVRRKLDSCPHCGYLITRPTPYRIERKHPTED
jgi:hypothetical protein